MDPILGVVRVQLDCVLAGTGHDVVLDTCGEGLVEDPFESLEAEGQLGNVLEFWLTRNPGAAFSVGTGETVVFTVIAFGVIVYIARTQVNRVMAVDLHIGSRLPAYCTSMGRILLAYLPPEQLEQYLAKVNLVPHTTRTITSPARGVES